MTDKPKTGLTKDHVASTVLDAEERIVELDDLIRGARGVLDRYKREKDDLKALVSGLKRLHPDAFK